MTQVPTILCPIEDRIVVSPMVPEDQTPGGIVLPSKAQQKSNIGRIVALGPGRVFDNGTIKALSLKLNEIVMYDHNAGRDIEIGDRAYRVMRERDVIGVLRATSPDENQATREPAIMS